MKSKTAGAAYKAARGNLLAMLVLTAVNTLLALTGSDRYYPVHGFCRLHLGGVCPGLL